MPSAVRSYFAAETESALGISAVSADPVSTALQLSDNSYGKSSSILADGVSVRVDGRVFMKYIQATADEPKERA